MLTLQDVTVPYSLSLKIAEQLASSDVDLVMRKQEVRDFSNPDDLELLFLVLNQLLKNHPIKMRNHKELSHNILKSNH
jgi:hypothetical protein